MRGDAALVTCPKDELVKLPFTELAPSNCVVECIERFQPEF
jgi:hypothetical protein